MDLSNILTIVIPLKGRPEYTKRILEYSSWIKCPFKILLGDGGNENLVLNSKDFPDTNYEYIKYPYDVDIPSYNKKMNNLLSKVTTPLTMLIDNDNFFCLEGIYHVINFLYNNKDFSGGRGCLTRCRVAGHKLNDERRKMHYHPSIIGVTATERIINTINMFHTHLHDIVKTDVLQTTFDIMDIVASNDFKIFIRLNAFLSVIRGNNYRNDDITYFFHEQGTPRISGQILPPDNIWVQQPYWEDSVARLTSAVGVSIEHMDGLNIDVAKNIFLKAFINRILNRKNPGHKISDTDSKTRDYLANSINTIIEKSRKLNIDEEIRGCFFKNRTGSELNISRIEINRMDDEMFRDVLDEYLVQRRFC